MNERDTTLLNNYFNGLLSPPEAQQVRERADDDPVFGQEFTLRAEMEAYPRRATQRQAFTDTLVAVEKDFFQDTTVEKAQSTPPMTAKVNWGRWLAAAAASLALLGGAYWFLSQSTAPEYRQYAQYAPLSLTVRGESDNTVSAAEQAFASKNYAAALAALEQLLAQDPNNITAQLYKGICLLELDRPADARTAWNPLASGTSALKSEAQWYIALSYLKAHDNVACKSALESIEPGADRYKDAQDLLKKLK